MAKKVPNLMTHNKLIVFLSGVPKRFRWVLTSSFLAFLVLLWGIFLYIPLIHSISGEKKRAFIEKVDDIISIESTKKGELLDLDEKIMVLSKKAGLVCNSISSSGIGSILVIISGHYSNSLLFLDSLCRLRAVIGIKKFVCKRLGNGEIELKLNVHFGQD